jgi:3-hydroxymyristoyl/3-hydroxydecanoyl-(acyl carrier protein) dehydratase
MATLSFHIPVDHPAFAGHFPGMPITPGVVLLDQAMHAIARQLQLDTQTCKINSVKFLRPVLPDTRLTMNYEVAANGNIRFDIKDDQHIAATGVFHV